MEFDAVGRYRILRELGRGGMGSVYVARDPHLPREVALKLLRPDQSGDANLRSRFQREAQTIAGLEHFAVVPVYDYGEVDGRLYLVMRLMRGGTLKERLRGGPLPRDLQFSIVERIASALDRAHASSMVHRDLKPANILFDDDGKAYLSDFGIVKLYEGESNLTRTGGILGTPTYMAPEQGLGRPVDHRSDIYSLGVVLYEMVTGRVPFQADTAVATVLKHVNEPLPPPRSIHPGVSDHVERVLLRALAKEPQERFVSAGEMAKTLLSPPSAVWAGATMLEQAPQVPPAAPAPSRRRPRSVYLAGAVGAVLLLSLLAGGLWALSGQGQEDRLRTPAAIISDSELAESATEEIAAAATATPTPTATVMLTPTPSATATTIPTAMPTATPTVALLAGSTLAAESDGKQMVYVPAGDFLMGSPAGDTVARVFEMPQRIVYLDAFWIDRTETTTAQYQACVQAGSCLHPQQSSSREREHYFGNPQFADFPVIWVDWSDANAYCHWAGRRLPTEAEWEKAARGTDGRTFPWGDTLPSAATANICDINCPYEWRDIDQDDGYWDTAPVSAFAAGASPYGALNMGGNVWEWVSDFYDPAYYSYAPQRNPQGPPAGETHVLRGGSWQNVWEFVRTATRDRETTRPENLYNVGFRCAQSAQ